MLIIIGGLPGTGKSTIGKKLAEKLQAVYLRIDSIEQAIKETHLEKGEFQMGPEGYMVAYAIARDNLAIDLTVVADSVNALHITRRAWRKVAKESDKLFIEVEFICSNKGIHRHRIEQREATVPGLKLPTWEDVLSREYDPWQEEHLVIDTATCSIDEAVKRISDRVQKLTNDT